MDAKYFTIKLFGRVIRVEFVKAPKKEELDEHMQAHLENMENKEHYSEKYLWFYKLPTIEKNGVEGFLTNIKIFWLRYGLIIRIMKRSLETP